MKAAGIAVVLAVIMPVHATVSAPGARVLTLPALWLAALALVLALAAAVLWLLRAVLRDGGFWRLRPRVVST